MAELLQESIAEPHIAEPKGPSQEVPSQSLTLSNEYRVIGQIEDPVSQEAIQAEPLVTGRLQEVAGRLGPIARAVVDLIPVPLRASLYISVKLEEYGDDDDKSAGYFHIDGDIEVGNGEITAEQGLRMLCVFGGLADTEVLTESFTVALNGLDLSTATDEDLAWCLSNSISTHVAGGLAVPVVVKNQNLFQFSLDTAHRRGKIKQSGLRLLVGFGVIH